MNTVSFGKASWIGTIGAAAAVLVPFIPALADAARDLGIPGQVWVWAAAILASVTVIGRMWQAVVNTIYGTDEVEWVDETTAASTVDPDLFQEGA